MNPYFVLFILLLSQALIKWCFQVLLPGKLSLKILATASLSAYIVNILIWTTVMFIFGKDSFPWINMLLSCTAIFTGHIIADAIYVHRRPGV